MKKILILLCLILITGCSDKQEENKYQKYEEDNKKIVEKIQNIEIDGIKEFEGLMVLDNNTIETEMGLTINDLENYIIQVPYFTDSKIYIVAKPSKDKEERVKNQINIYLDSIKHKLENLALESPEETKDEMNKKLEMFNNMKKEEYNGYLIYISSSNNDQILNIITEYIK